MCCIALSLPTFFFPAAGLPLPSWPGPSRSGQEPRDDGGALPARTVPPGAVPPAWAAWIPPSGTAWLPPSGTAWLPASWTARLPPGRLPAGPLPPGAVHAGCLRPARRLCCGERVRSCFSRWWCCFLILFFMSVHSKVMLLVHRVLDGSGS